jgi:site-specific recombinase XerD
MGEQGLLAHFREHLVGKDMAPATVVNYIADVKCFGDWMGAKLKWAKEGSQSAEGLGAAEGRDGYESTLTWGVKAEHVRQYCRALYQEGRSVSTINRRIQALRKFYDFVEQSGFSSSNPARAVQRMDEPGAVSPRVLTDHEMERLLRAVQESDNALACRDGAILMLLVETGLKVGELVELKFDDLRFEGREASPKSRGTLVLGEDDGAERRLSLGAAVCEALQACMRMRASGFGRAGERPGAHLFVNRRGEPLSVRSVQRLVAHYARRADLEGVSTRTLRHTFARRILEMNSDPVQVARMLGLRDIAGVRRYLD